MEEKWSKKYVSVLFPGYSPNQIMRLVKTQEELGSRKLMLTRMTRVTRMTRITLTTWVGTKKAHSSWRKEVCRVSREARSPSVTKVAKRPWPIKKGWNDEQAGCLMPHLQRISFPSRWRVASSSAPWSACSGTRPGQELITSTITLGQTLEYFAL